MSKIKFRSKYDGLQDAVTAETAFVNDSDDVRTKQAFAAETNINNILRKYSVTGVLPDEARRALGGFGDFTGRPSYEEALNKVVHAQELFADLPSAVRNRFRNDPGELLSFLGDRANRDEAVKLGLIDPSTGKPPLPVAPGGRTEEPSAPPTPPKEDKP